MQHLQRGIQPERRPTRWVLALLDVSTITGLLGKKWEPSALLIMPQQARVHSVISISPLIRCVPVSSEAFFAGFEAWADCAGRYCSSLEGEGRQTA